MRTADILDTFTKPLVRDIASRLGFVVPPATPKPEMVTFVARSLGARCGWDGAIDEVLGVLRREELIEFLDVEWSGDDGQAFLPTSKLTRLRADELRELARDLLLAEDEDPTTRVSDVLTGHRWEGVFLVCDDDDDDDDEVYSADSVAPASLAPSWHHDKIIEVDAGGRLPGGFEEQAPRRPLEHQLKALHHLGEWFRRGGRAGILCMPTGSGKTQTATQFIVQQAASPGETVLWLTHRDELVDQAIRTLVQTAHSCGRALRVGRYQGGLRKAEEPVDVLVASIPTLARAGALGSVLDVQNAIRLVVVDECHHAAAPSWRKLLDRLAKRQRIKLVGLSATPTRTVERERDALWRIFDGTIIHEAHAAELIARGVLAKPDLKFIETNRKYDASPEEFADWNRFHRGDLPPSLVKRIASDRVRNELIAQHAVAHAASGPTLVFASEKDSARTVVEMIVRRGGKAALITYEDTAAERKSVLQAFRSGHLPILVNLTIFSEGTDLPDVRNVLIGRPTTSPILFSQMVGRGLRGKAIGGTERCQVVVFHETVLNLASHALTTNFADSRSALTALGCQELIPSEEALEPPPAPSARRPSVDATRMPTRDPEGLRAKMQAMLSMLAGHGPPPSSAWTAVPVPLTGWWRIEGRGRRWYLPVFGPDEVVVNHVMRDLALHVTGYALRPTVQPVVCLPDGTVERFIDRAVAEKATPTFVAVDATDASEKASFAHAVLAGDEGELVTPARTEAPAAADALVVDTLKPSAPRLPSSPPDTEKVDGPLLAEHEGRLLTAPLPAAIHPPVAVPLPAAAQASTRSATLPVGPNVAAAPEPRSQTVVSAARPSNEELQSVLHAARAVPRQHRREWLAQVHERRFRERYPDLLDFAIELMAQGRDAQSPAGSSADDAVSPGTSTAR